MRRAFAVFLLLAGCEKYNSTSDPAWQALTAPKPKPVPQQEEARPVVAPPPESAAPPGYAPAMTVTPADTCAATLKLSACFSEPESEFNRCATTCIEEIDAKNQERSQAALKKCEEHQVSDPGKAVTCGLAPSAPMDDLAKLKAEVQTAMKAKDREKLDAVFGRLLSQVMRDADSLCVKTCRDQGKAGREGPELVMSYKRCMVRADTTTEALTYRLHERALYCDYVQKADARCREANRCDWLEGLTGQRCTYDRAFPSGCQGED